MSKAKEEILMELRTLVGLAREFFLPHHDMFGYPLISNIEEWIPKTQEKIMKIIDKQIPSQIKDCMRWDISCMDCPQAKDCQQGLHNVAIETIRERFGLEPLKPTEPK